MKAVRSPEKAPARMKYEDHKKLWRIVEGAVVAAYDAHPDYFTEKGRKAVVQSITKRVVGAIISAHNEAR